jgi:predicted PolB exonuclease-like 3'-5' exonuclease
VRHLIFDIETRIDKELVRDVFFRGEGLGEQEAFERMREQLQEQGRDFFPLTCHRPVSIAVGDVDDDGRLVSLATLAAGDEDEMVRDFWRRVGELDGSLVSFNGRHFDLPVLELQALRLGIAAAAYFDDPLRFRDRRARCHYDLLDFLSNGGAHRLRGGFDLLARLAGLPGKSEMDGSRVQAEWEAGNLEAIHRYCRDDVLQTYLLFVRLELLRGRVEAAKCAQLQAEATGRFRTR